MPKARWAVSAEEPEDAETYDVYDGPKPPGGIVYQCRLTRFLVKANKNDEPMLNGLLIVNEPKSKDNSKYNGYGIWFNQNVTEQGGPYVKQFLAALSLTWAEFRNKTVLEGDMPRKKGDPTTRIMKIGAVKFNDGNEPELRVLTKEDSYNGAPKLSATQFLPPRGKGQATNDDDAEADARDDTGDNTSEDTGGRAPF